MTKKDIISFRDRRIKTSEIAIAKEYREALDYVRQEMSKIYEKYATDGVLTYAEMTKYNRFNSLQKELIEEMNLKWKGIEKETRLLVSEEYEESYFRHGYLLNKEIGINVNYGLIPNETIRSLFYEPNVSGLSLAETLGKTRYNLLLKERQAMIQGFIRGDSYVNMIKNLKGEWNKSFNDILRILKTEGGRASTDGQLAVFDKAEEMGVELDRIWVHALGGQKNPRSSHEAADGQKADENGMFHVGGYTVPGPRKFGVAAEDINCLCDIIAKPKGTEFKVRRSNIGEKKIIDYKTYEEWKKDQK